MKEHPSKKEIAETKELLETNRARASSRGQTYIRIVGGALIGITIQGALLITKAPLLFRGAVPLGTLALNALLSEWGQGLLLDRGITWEDSSSSLLKRLSPMLKGLGSTFSIEHISQELLFLNDAIKSASDTERTSALVKEAMALQARYDYLINLRESLFGVLIGVFGTEGLGLVLNRIPTYTPPQNDPSVLLQV